MIMFVKEMVIKYI